MPSGTFQTAQCSAGRQHRSKDSLYEACKSTQRWQAATHNSTLKMNVANPQQPQATTTQTANVPSHLGCKHSAKMKRKQWHDAPGRQNQPCLQDPAYARAAAQCFEAPVATSDNARHAETTHSDETDAPSHTTPASLVTLTSDPARLPASNDPNNLYTCSTSGVPRGVELPVRCLETMKQSAQQAPVCTAVLHSRAFLPSPGVLCPTQ